MKTAEEIVNEIYPNFGTIDAEEWRKQVKMVNSELKEHAIELMKYWNAGMHSDKKFEKFYNDWINSNKLQQ